MAVSCPICQTPSNNHSNLVEHLMTHYKPWRCSSCTHLNGIQTRRDHLVRHVRRYHRRELLPAEIVPDAFREAVKNEALGLGFTFPPTPAPLVLSAVAPAISPAAVLGIVQPVVQRIAPVTHPTAYPAAHPVAYPFDHPFLHTTVAPMPAAGISPAPVPASASRPRRPNSRWGFDQSLIDPKLIEVDRQQREQRQDQDQGQ